MDSLLEQTRWPNEIVICDGGSEDSTVEILKEYLGRLPGLRIVAEPGSNISQGRNRAVSEAKGTVIACTDAGVRLDPNWLEQLIAPFEEGAPTQEGCVWAVGGFFVPEVSGPFQVAMGATVLPQWSRRVDAFSFSAQQPVHSLLKGLVAKGRRVS